MKDVEYLKYNISNKLAYKIGFISSCELFSRGISNRYEFYLIKQFALVSQETQVSLINHLKFMTLSSNFLYNQNVLAYLCFSTEEIIKIMENPSFTIINIPQNDTNIVSWPSFGTYCNSINYVIILGYCVIILMYGIIFWLIFQNIIA